MTAISNEDVVRFIRTKQQPLHGHIVCRIVDDLNKSIAKLNSAEMKTFVFSTLDNLTSHFDFSVSFNDPVYILYHEYISEEVMVVLHQWLRTKCANIENITVVFSQSLGMAQWWKCWCDTYHEKSFSVVELSWAYTENGYRHHFSPTQFSRHTDIVSDKNNLMQYYFSYYAGGTVHYNDRSYISLRVSEFMDYCLFDSLYTLPPKQEILNYVESITYFSSQETVDLISLLYDANVNTDGSFKIPANENTQNRTRFEGFNFNNNFQWSNDSRCFASVIRETKNNALHQTLTEKTLRVFWNHLVAVPLCYNSVENLEAQGFWFPHNLIDYRYQSVKDFNQRVSAAMEQIKKLISDYTIEQLKKYYNDHVEHFFSNAQIIENLAVDSQRLNQKYI